MTDIILSTLPEIVAAEGMTTRADPSGLQPATDTYSGLAAGRLPTANYDNTFSAGYKNTGIEQDFKEWDGIHDNFFLWLQHELFDYVPESVAEEDTLTEDDTTVLSGDALSKGFIEKDANKSIFLAWNFGGYYSGDRTAEGLKNHIESVLGLTSGKLTANTGDMTTAPAKSAVYLASTINNATVKFKTLYLWIYRPYGDRHDIFAVKMFLGIYKTVNSAVITDGFEDDFINNNAISYSLAPNGIVKDYVFAVNSGSLIIPSFTSTTWNDPNPQVTPTATAGKPRLPKGIFANASALSINCREKGIFPNRVV